MKSWKVLTFGIATVAVAAATLCGVPARQDSRSVRLLPEIEDLAPEGPFDPEQSAALFIGIQKFTEDQISEVRYAVDDAIDLAYAFVFERRARLVRPGRVVLALSGEPKKKVSATRLKDLKDLGVRINKSADADTILQLLEQQTATAGRDGIFILSIASHGFVHNGNSYVLGSSSTFRDPKSALSSATLFELAGSSAARRSLVLVDACRERIESGTRAAAPNLMTAAPLIRRMRNVQGQVIFYAAAPGQYAYDDPESGNGVFTKMLIEGLRCNATATRGVVTARNLHTYVDRKVLQWIRERRDPNTTVATQLSVDGRADLMPLSSCSVVDGPGDLARLTAAGPIVTGFDLDGVQLWEHNLGNDVLRAELTDLDGDVEKEVVAGTDGQLVAFDSDGKRLWSHRDDMTLRTLGIADPYRDRPRKIVALWIDEREPISHLSILSTDGRMLDSYEHRGRLQHMLVGRPNGQFKPRVIVAGTNEVLVLDPAKTKKPEWHRTIASGETIERLAIDDDDVSVTTATGKTFLFALRDGAARTEAPSRPQASSTPSSSPPPRTPR